MRCGDAKHCRPAVANQGSADPFSDSLFFGCDDRTNRQKMSRRDVAQIECSTHYARTALFAEVAGANSLPEIRGEWNGREMELWSEGNSDKMLHGLLGIDLEKPAGKYEWTDSWKTRKVNR